MSKKAVSHETLALGARSDGPYKLVTGTGVEIAIGEFPPHLRRHPVMRVAVYSHDGSREVVRALFLSPRCTDREYPPH